jgi:hypothetical protein
MARVEARKMTPLEKELLTPQVVGDWKRIATMQLENKRERITIPTTLLLAMIIKIQANEVTHALEGANK